MELVERYLQAVRFLLPKKQRHDVDREISEDLRSQIEEKENELGRALDEDELASLLKRFGHPALLALRYQPERHLIGPTVFPLFWFAVRFLLAILAIVHILLPAIFFIMSGEPAGKIVGLFLRFPGVAAPVLAWITLGFVVVDTTVVRNAIERSLADWRPQSLPQLVKEQAEEPPSATGVVLTALFSAWWLVGLHFPHFLLGPAADYIAFGPIFHRLYVPMAAAAIAGVGFGCLRLSRPHGVHLSWIGGLVVDAMGLVILYLLARGSNWLVAREAAMPPGSEGLIEFANLGVEIGLSVTLVVAAVAFVWKYLTHVRAWSGRSGPTPPRTS